MSKWKEIGLGDVATFYNGYPFKPTDWSTTGKEIIRIQNLTKGSSQTNYFEGKLSNKYSVTKGDILISWSGSLGIYEWEKEDAWLNQHLFKVVFDKEEVDKSFFKYLISNSLEKLETQVHGATMKHITKKNFDAFPVNLPPLPQQQKIANILDAADALRQNDKALIAKYDELTQALFLDMFGDPVSNPKGWDIDILGNYCKKIQIGPFGSQLHMSDYVEEGIPLINPTNIKNGIIDYNSSVKITVSKYDSLPNYHLKIGDIVMARRGDLSKIGIVDKVKSFCGTGSLYLRLKENFDSVYCYWLLSHKSTVEKLYEKSQGVTMANLNKGIIISLPIVVPNLKLQKEFINRISLIEEQKATAQKSLEQSERLFNSLLQKAFKGEL